MAANDDPLAAPLEVQQAVLACCLCEPDAMLNVADKLTKAHFTDHACMEVWEAMDELHRERQPIDIPSLSARLQRRGLWQQTMGLVYQLEDLLPDASRLAAYVDALNDSHCRRQAMRLAKKLQRMAVTYEGHGDELFARCAAAAQAMDERTNGSRSPDLAQMLAEVRPGLLRKGGIEMRAIWGWPSVDRVSLGLQPKRLHVLAGRPAMGKSSAAVAVVRATAKLGYHVAVASLEMARQEYIMRILSQETGVSLSEIMGESMNQEQRDVVVGCSDSIPGWPFKMEDQWRGKGVQLAEKIIAWARRERQWGGLDLLVVDHLHEISRDTKELEQIPTMFKAFAMEEHQGRGTAVLLLAQLSRRPKEIGHGAGNPPVLEDLRGSGSIEEVADLVAFLHRPGYYDGKRHPGETQFIIAKHRNGWTGTLDLQFVPETTDFRER